jgi:hypothetical protein
MQLLSNDKYDSGRARNGSSRERLARENKSWVQGAPDGIVVNFHNPRSRHKVYIAGQRKVQRGNSGGHGPMP